MDLFDRPLFVRTFALFTLLGLALIPGPGLAASPLPAGVSLPPGVKLPAGVDVNQLLNQMSGNKPSRETREQTGTVPTQVAPGTPVLGSRDHPEAKLRRLAEDLLWDGRLTDDREKRLDRQAEDLGLTQGEAQKIYTPYLKKRAALVQSALVQARALMGDGKLTNVDRAYLEQRLRDMGLDNTDSNRIVSHVKNLVRKQVRYASFLRAFLEDGVFDDAEQNQLEQKRIAFGLSTKQHDEILEIVRAELRDPARDVLGEIRIAEQGRETIRPHLPLYGRALFEKVPGQTFEPPTNLPPPDDYRIGPGDRFRVSLWGRLEDEFILEVDSEGRVLFPKIGPIQVADLTYAEARDLLDKRAESITGVTAAVILDGTRSVRVFVVGELKKPGSVILSPLSTVVHAVMAAHGPTNLGSLRHVVLRRAGVEIAVFDLYKFLLRGEIVDSQPLQNGDVVVVPRAKRTVGVWGKVKRPAVYELVDGEGLRATLDYAGGLATDAYGGRVQVERTANHQRRIALDVFLADLSGDFPLEDGDRIRVFPLPPKMDNRVSLYGHVLQPGTYAWTDGMRVRDLVGTTDNLKPNVDLGYAVILREQGPGRVKVAVSFRLGLALDDSSSGENLFLQPRDEVYIFDRDQFRPPLRAGVEGRVRTPGLYRFEPGTRIADLVRLAGGLESDALLAQAEILRYLPDRTRNTLYVDLNRALAGDASQNLELANEDKLIVHSIWDETFRDTVWVSGQVKRPGEVPLTRAMSVKDLVFKAGGLTKDAYLGVAHLYRTDRVTKEVTIHTFHLGQALAGAPEANLLLQDLDKITIHSAYEFVPKQNVLASGWINNPGEQPYATNMHVRDLVLASGGLKEEAYLHEAEITRREVDSGEEARTRTLSFDLEKAMAGDPKANLQLEPYDKLLVKRIPEWRDIRKIELKGEVRFPGTYYITKGERLSSVLDRAGGYTNEAYLRGAIFTRESARKLQQKRLDELMKWVQENVLRLSSENLQAALGPEEAALQEQYLTTQKVLLAKLSQARATGRVVIQLNPLDNLRGSDSNIILEDGDALEIPEIPVTVAVVGQVYNPTSLVWESSNRQVEYYLDKTGGPTPAAEDNEIYVVRADGTVVSPDTGKNSWWGRGVLGLNLYPGDAILVPDKVIQTSPLKFAKDVSQVMFQIAVTAGVAVALF